MKAVLDFSAELLVTLKQGVSPSDGFFYLRRVRISGDEGAWLTSSFISAEGNTCFWEEPVEASWSESDNSDEWIVSISGSGVGVEINDEEHAETCAFVTEADEEDPDVLEDVFKVEVAFKSDGDTDEDLVVKQSCTSVFESSVEICGDDRWSELGYD